MDKKYYVGEKPKHKKLQYILLTLFGIFALVFLASLFVSAFTSYDLEILTYVSLILVAIGAFVPIILGICEPQPLCNWSADKCFLWLHVHRPENMLLPVAVYNGLGSYVVYYMELDSNRRLQLAVGNHIEVVARDAVYKANESRLKEARQ